jgi:phytoene dehydrogenase-like protein
MAVLKYDHVVVGSGVSGMTAALLLALNGRKVLLLEKAPAIGGSMARFRCQGVPFDTGFHFTGGFSAGGLMCEMLQILGIRNQIHPLHFSNSTPVRFVFEQTGESFEFPATREKLQASLMAYFPADADAVDEYFRRIDDVCTRTANMDIRLVGSSPDLLDEDYVSLQAVLDELSGNEKLKTLLAAYCMCYGVGPAEVSFANHARMCQAMYEELVRIEGGGGAFVDAFKEALQAAGVDILCGRHIAGCEDIQDSMVGSFRLNTGEKIGFDTCLFTIHPKQVLEMLPKDYLRNAFVNRVSAFESSIGFFSVFGTCDDLDIMEDCMVTLFPDTDINRMLEPGHRNDDSALFFISGVEQVGGAPRRAVTAFEVACPEDFEEWADSSLMKRPEAYAAYKKAKTERIHRRIIARFPELENNFKVLTSSSVLTFRDYLNSPDGSAYGVKQKMGQFNLFGKLPLRNLYVAGQSSLLPGVMGAMMSSFITARALVDKTQFNEFIHRRLG